MAASDQRETQIRAMVGHEVDSNQAFFNWAEALAKRLKFPLTAVWWDETFTLTGIDLIESSHSHGLKMLTPTMPEPLPYHELTFISLDSQSAEWLAAFDHWREANL